ncbi:MAG: sigma-70 family RNA polymerase sigma factor [Mollicutes bacterium]|nr:sigma-70 family RNA polymerase sigma factor [Mollicutes bacterium]
MSNLHLYQGIVPEPLSEEEIIQNLKLFKEGDLKAKNKIIVHNIRLVFKIANKLTCDLNILDDCFSIGMIGLIQAVNTFDENKKSKFTTYAYKCIVNEIFMYFRKEKRVNNKKVSLDEMIYDNDEITRNDVIFDNDDYFLMDDNDSEIIDYINEAYNLLSEKEKKVIDERYIKSNKTQREISKLLNVSQNQISVIEGQALSKFRNYIRSKGIHITEEIKKTKREKVKIR